MFGLSVYSTATRSLTRAGRDHTFVMSAFSRASSSWVITRLRQIRRSQSVIVGPTWSCSPCWVVALARVRARRCGREMAEFQPGREPLVVTGALRRRAGRSFRSDLGRPVHDPRSATARVVRHGHRSAGAGSRSRDKRAVGLFPDLGAEYRPRPQTGPGGSGRRTAHERRAGRPHRGGAHRCGARLSDHAVGDCRGGALRDPPVHGLHRFDRHVRCPLWLADRARRMGRGGFRATSQLGTSDARRRAAGTGWRDQALTAGRRRRSQRGRRAASSPSPRFVVATSRREEAAYAVRGIVDRRSRHC